MKIFFVCNEAEICSRPEAKDLFNADWREIKGG